MSISHIQNIRYKGFHPTDKKNIIYDINLLIDKFNEDNNMLRDSLWDLQNPNNFNVFTENAMIKKLGNHRHYLLSYLHEIKFNIVKLNERLFYIREKEFQKFIDSLTKDSKKSIETIKKDIFNWYLNEKNFIKSEREKIDDALKETTAITIERATVKLKSKQEKKRKALLDKCTLLIKHIETKYKDNKKADELFIALKRLKFILSRKDGNLTYDLAQPLIACFRSNRNWSPIKKSSEKILYPPIPRADSITNQIIINLYGMVTDGGTDFIGLIKSYVDGK